MKRHPSLHPLSRDHHQALVQARDLCRAATAHDIAGLAQSAAQFAVFWERDLHAHFLQEEEFVLPMLATHLSPDCAEIGETLKQHAEIRRLIGKLNDDLMRRVLPEAHLLNTLGEALRRHIRYEENELFPALEAAVTEADLWRMHEQLEIERSRTVQSGCALRSQVTGDGQ